MKFSYLIILFVSSFLQLTSEQLYVDKDVKVIVHVPPGGGTDNMARLVLRFASKILKANFVIENHKGAGGQVGYSVLARAKPDGNTMGTITTLSIVTHELTRKNVSYKFKENFIPIARVVLDPSALFVLSSDTITSLEQLITIAKKLDKKITVAGTAYWGSHYVHLKQFERLTGVKNLQYIPFDGASEVRNMLLGKHIRLAFGGLSNFQSLIKAGKIRPIVVASEERIPSFPDVPTYKELGYDLVVGSSRGFAFPKDTPQEYVAILSSTILEVLKDPEFLEQANRMGFKDFINPLDSEGFYDVLLELSVVMKDLINSETIRN